MGVIYEVILLDESRLPVFRWRPIEGLISEIDPTFLTELVKMSEKAVIKGEDEVRNFISMGNYLLIIHHDGDNTGVKIIKDVVEKNLGEDPNKIIEEMREALIPLPEELDYIIGLIPKEEFEIRYKRINPFMKLKLKIRGANIRESFISGKFDEVILAQPKNDVERMIRVVSGAYLNRLPPKYPAPKLQEILEHAERIENEPLKELALAYVDRLQAGLTAHIVMKVMKIKEELKKEIEKDKIIALPLVQVAPLSPELQEFSEIVKKEFPKTYRYYYLEALEAIFKASYSKNKIDAAISILSSFKKDIKDPERKIFESIKIAAAAEVLMYEDVDDLERVVKTLSEEVIRAQTLAYEGLKEEPRVFVTRLITSNATLAFVSTLVGLYYYHNDVPIYRAYFMNGRKTVEELIDKIFEYLKYERFSPTSALVALSLTFPIMAYISEMTGERFEKGMKMPMRLARFIENKRPSGTEAIYEADRDAFVNLSLLLIDAFVSGFKYITLENKGIALDLAKNVLERLLISKYSEVRSVTTLLGLSLPKVRAIKGASEKLVTETSNLIKSKLGSSFASFIVLAEMSRRLEEAGFHDLAEIVSKVSS